MRIALCVSLGCCLVACGTDGAATPQLPKQLGRGVSDGKSDAVERNRLYYYGGHRISWPHVVPIAWGTDVARADQLSTFYAWFLKSAAIDVVAQYFPFGSTPEGSASGVVYVDAATTDTITDAQIRDMLEGLMNAKTLARPTSNDLYAVHTPPSATRIIDPYGGVSCTDYCGYHSSFRNARYGVVRYAVIPDLSQGPCAESCAVEIGDDATMARITTVASHEIAEALTDPDIGLYDGSNPQVIGYYDPYHGEVGDICAHDVGVLDGWVVQTEWSNLAERCVLSLERPAPPKPQVLLSASVATLTIMADQPATLTLSSKLVSGAREPLALTASTEGAPGVVVTFDPPTLIAGDSTTVTFTGANLTKHKNATITLHAVGATTDVSVTLVAELRPLSWFHVQTPSGVLVVNRGAATTFNVTVVLDGGTPLPLSLAVKSLPAHVTATFEPSSVMPGETATATATATLTADADAIATLNQYFEVTAANGALVAAAMPVIRVAP